MTPPDRPVQSGEVAPVVRNVPFNFRLGEVTLFAIVRRLAVLDIDSGCLPHGWKPAPGATDGCLVKGLRAPPDARLLAPSPGWSVRVVREYPRYLVDLRTGFDAYMAKFSGKTRSTLKRKMRKFQDLSGGMTNWKKYQTRDEIAEFLSLARALSQKTYQERLLKAGLPAGAEFTADALSHADRGGVRGFILFLEGKPVSYLYLPVDGGRVVYAYLGYDPACAEHSPGTVLQLLAMESLFSETGLSLFDFTEGDGSHKQLFSTHSENCVDILFVKRASLTNYVALAHSLFVRLIAAATGVLDRLGLKAYLKRRIRGAAAKPQPE